MSVALRSRRAVKLPIPGAADPEFFFRKARRQHLEDDLQRSVVQFLRLALPPDAIAFSVPNGGKRHPREAARMTGLGLVPGIPDLLVCFRGRLICIELKTARGVVSPAQRETHRVLLYCGAEVMTCRSEREVEAQLREMGVPLKASVT